MSRPRPPFARVTRLMPEGAALSRSTGQPIAVGAEVADGEAVVLATPGGVPGAVTLDRRGVAISIKTVALAAAPVAVPVYESGPRVSADPVLPMAGSVGVRALAAPEAAPAVKPPVGVRSGSTIEAAKVALASSTGPASVEEVAAVRVGLDAPAKPTPR